MNTNKTSNIKENLYNNPNTISPERYVFWLDDVSVLYRDEGYIRFLPTSDMTRVEQLNAFTRFFLYLIIILLLFDKSDELIYIPIIGIIMMIGLYNVFDNDEKGKRSELLRMKQTKEMMTNQSSDLNYRTYQVNENGNIVTVDIDQEEYEKYKDGLEMDLSSTDYDVEAGYYDSNGKLQVGAYKDAVTSQKKKKETDNIKYSLDEMRMYEMAKCRKPTVDNPFMNAGQDDFNKDDLPACNADDDDIKKEIELNFNADLYRDIEDVFDRKNSQRQFFTVAQNLPTDQEAFARWCYKFPSTCKTNQERCLRYEDLRTKY